MNEVLNNLDGSTKEAPSTAQKAQTLLTNTKLP